MPWQRRTKCHGEIGRTVRSQNLVADECGIANYFENVKNGYYKYFVLAEKIAEYQAKAASYYIG